jgi:HEAT repeat protein
MDGNDGADIDAKIMASMDLLASEDGVLRRNARVALVAIGERAIAPLSRALSTSRLRQLRWEAAKALEAIGSPLSIPSLVRALTDRDRDVAWVAAEGLIKFKIAAWPALFRALVKDGANSVSLRREAHHVLCAQKEAGFEDLLPSLLKDLEASGLRESAMVTAGRIYRRLSGKDT